MKFSEQLKQDHDCGDFGQALDGYSEKAHALEKRVEALEDAILHAHMVGQSDAGIDPSYSNALSYKNSVLEELENSG